LTFLGRPPVHLVIHLAHAVGRKARKAGSAREAFSVQVHWNGRDITNTDARKWAAGGLGLEAPFPYSASQERNPNKAPEAPQPPTEPFSTRTTFPFAAV
jgi:hypothetical protein